MGDRARNKLTALEVRKAGDGKIFDGGGLALIRKGGVGKWVFRYSHLGRRREMGLGPQSSVSLSEARAARDEWARVLSRGEDPIAVRDAQRAQEVAERDRLDPTFADMAQTVLDARKARLRGEGERGRWWSPLRLYVIPRLGRKRMAEITPADIKDVLAPIWQKKHPTATKALGRIRIVFRDARLMGVECDPFTVDAAQHMLGAVRHVTRHIEATPWQEVPDLYAQLRERGDLASTLALRWALLTLVRGMAVRGARFDEIEGDVWTVPAERVKGREGAVQDFRVPLSPEAQLVAQRAASYSPTWLFPGHRGNPITDVGMNKALAATGSAGTVHGFRTTFRTWVQDTGACSWEVAETILGHRIGNRVERSYARSDLLEPRRVALSAWAGYVTGESNNVVHIVATGE